LRPSELRTLGCAFDASCRAIVADAEYALALLYSARAARGSHADLLLAARHAEEAAQWLGGAIAVAVASAALDARRAEDLDAALALLTPALERLAGELQAQAVKGERWTPLI
jgi:hypothetical protein